MLALAPDELAPTDTADHAIAALRHSTVKEIVVLGRRGPVQAAFTTPELRELGDLAGADIVVREEDLRLDDRSAALVASGDLDATVKRNLELLELYASRASRGAPRRIELRFLASPVEIVGDGRVEAVRVVGNQLVWSDGSPRAKATSEIELIETGLVLRSVGYRGAPIRGVPFDDRSATIPNDSGRIVDATTGASVPGLYAAGWIKRGPSGVIGTNKKCANETVERLLEDLRGGVLPIPSVDADELAIRLAERGVQVVDYGGWEAIDAHERGLGAEYGRPRVKLVRRDEHLRHAAAAA
jgi:ferredoxin--NADP+ reductase